MRPQLIMFMACILLVGNLMCLMLQGSYYTSEDLGLMNYLTGYSGVEAAGAFGVWRMTVGFFTEGLPRLLLWDFSFFQGGWSLIRWFLMTFSIGVGFGVAVIFLGAIQSIFARR